MISQYLESKPSAQKGTEVPDSKRRKRSRNSSAEEELHPTWSDGMKRSPRWYAPLAVTIMGLGLLWLVLHYALALNLGVNLLGIGNWNIALGFAVIMVGFTMLMWWK